MESGASSQDSYRNYYAIWLAWRWPVQHVMWSIDTISVMPPIGPTSLVSFNLFTPVSCIRCKSFRLVWSFRARGMSQSPFKLSSKSYNLNSAFSIVRLDCKPDSHRKCRFITIGRNAGDIWARSTSTSEAAPCSGDTINQNRIPIAPIFLFRRCQSTKIGHPMRLAALA